MVHTSGSILHVTPQVHSRVQTDSEIYEMCGDYPTAARMRQKEKKKLIPVGTKKVKPVKDMTQYEKHYDDCGDDLSSIAMADNSYPVLADFDEIFSETDFQLLLKEESLCY